MNEHNFYNQNGYEKICRYIFGQEKTIPWKFLLQKPSKEPSPPPAQPQHQSLPQPDPPQPIAKPYKPGAYRMRQEIEEFLEGLEAKPPTKPEPAKQRKERVSCPAREQPKTKESAISSEVNRKIDQKLDELLLKKTMEKNQRKALEIMSSSLSNKPINRSMHPLLLPKKHEEPTISKGAAKIKEVEARAFQRYMADRRNRLERQPRETCPLKSSYI
jgi:hypothetical protein